MTYHYDEGCFVYDRMPSFVLFAYHFTGKERDAESGLDYFGARYYGSSMGRFMSPDYGGPMGDSHPDPVPWADLENPQSLNLYSYGGNNPLSPADDDGHSVNVCTTNTFGQQQCTLMSNEQYQAASQGNGSLNVPSLNTVGMNGDGNGQFNSTSITDSNENSVGSATYVSDGGADYYANRNGIDFLNNQTRPAVNGIALLTGVVSAPLAIAEVSAAFGGELTTLGDVSLEPTEREMGTAQRQLAQGGRKSVEKLIRTLSKRIAEHNAKIRQVLGNNPGANVNSMEREIATAKRTIEALRQVLK